MNRVTLKGNVGGDPEITAFENGGKVAQFSLATTERGYKTKDGKDIPERTEWHNIVVKRSGLAEVCEKNVKKGSQLLIEGKLQTRNYTDKDGITRYITEVIVTDMEFCGKKEGGSGGFTPAPAPRPEDEDMPDM